jgi:hypothetical protein
VTFNIFDMRQLFSFLDGREVNISAARTAAVAATVEVEVRSGRSIYPSIATAAHSLLSTHSVI